MTHEHITVSDDGGVRTIAFDDGKANVLPLDRTAALIEVIRDAEATDDVRALLIHGRPGRFSAGFDLSVMAAGDMVAVRAMVDGGGRLIETMYSSRLPIVSACTGHAIAAGALMLLASDIRIGPDADVKIGLNETAIGMVLPGWGLIVAEERLSRRHHMAAVCTAQLFDGAGAVKAGFLDEAVDPEQVISVARSEAVRLATLDGPSYLATINIVRRSALERIAADLAR